jgi:transcriptional regulator with XRE-family HTH domain
MTLQYRMQTLRAERQMDYQQLAAATNELQGSGVVTPELVQHWESGKVQVRDEAHYNELSALIKVLVQENDRIPAAEKASEAAQFNADHAAAQGAERGSDERYAFGELVGKYRNGLSDPQQRSYENFAEKVAKKVEVTVPVDPQESKALKERPAELMMAIEAGDWAASKGLQLAIVKAINGMQPLPEEEKVELHNAAQITRAAVEEENTRAIEQFTDSLPNKNPMALAREIVRVQQEEGLDGAQTAERFGLSKPDVSRYKSLLRLEPKTQEDIERGALSVTAAYKLARVTHEERREGFAGTLVPDKQRAPLASPEDIEATRQKLRDLLRDKDGNVPTLASMTDKIARHGKFSSKAPTDNSLRHAISALLGEGEMHTGDFIKKKGALAAKSEELIMTYIDASRFLGAARPVREEAEKLIEELREKTGYKKQQEAAPVHQNR